VYKCMENNSGKSNKMLCHTELVEVLACRSMSLFSLGRESTAWTTVVEKVKEAERERKKKKLKKE
jgi:hypothetical protein